MIYKHTSPITSLEEWEAVAGPKRPSQWQDHRSAKESARAWLAHGIPPEIRAVLATHPDFDEIETWKAEPECLVRFDEYGGPANVDVLVTARDEYRSFIMAVEAKADESFGPPLGRALTDALERRLRNANSKGVDRLVELSTSLLGPVAQGRVSRPRLHQIRYQLLTLSAAALAHAQAEGAARAVVMVHEFVTPQTQAKHQQRNGRDLLRFLTRLDAINPQRILAGELVGPISVPGGARFDRPVPLYFGKATRQVPRIQ